MAKKTAAKTPSKVSASEKLALAEALMHYGITAKPREAAQLTMARALRKAYVDHRDLEARVKRLERDRADAERSMQRMADKHEGGMEALRALGSDGPRQHYGGRWIEGPSGHFHRG